MAGRETYECLYCFDYTASIPSSIALLHLRECTTFQASYSDEGVNLAMLRLLESDSEELAPKKICIEELYKETGINSEGKFHGCG